MTSTPDQQADDGSMSAEPAQSSQFPQWLFANRWKLAPSLAGGLALVATLVTFWLVGSLAGIAAWLVIAGAWLAFPVIVPFALGYIALVALVPDAGVTVTLPAQVSLLGLLLGETVSQEKSIRNVAVFVGGTAVLATVFIWIARTASLLIAAGVGLCLICLVSYFLHRYLLLQLGLLAGDEEAGE